MIATFLAGFLAILPGFPVAYLLRSPSDRFDSITCKAIVWSLAITSFIAWGPLGTRIPLDLWLWCLAGLSLVGAIVAITASLIRPRQKHSKPEMIIGGAACVVFVVFAIMLFVQALVGWDAIAYYLFSAVDITLWGHYSDYFSSAVTINEHAPNTVMPIMPVLYGLAILIAQHLHTYADQAVRLTPLAFVVGSFLATRRIANHFMPRSWSLAAATLFLLIPGYVSNISNAPLSLDLGFCFLCTQLIAMLIESDFSFAGLFQLGLTAAVTIMDKVDGFPFVCLLLFVIIIVRFPTFFGRSIAALLVIAMFFSATVLHLYAGASSIELFVSFAVVGTAFVVSVRKSPGLRLSWRGACAVALGLVPAFFELWKLIYLTGSPAGFYVPSLATKQPAAWLHSVSLITKANVFVYNLQPGLPTNYGAGLLFSWEFSAPLVILAIIGAVSAYRSKLHGAVLLASIAILFDFAFLTIFALGDYRHLMPTFPLIAILAAVGVRRLAKTLPSRITVIAIALVATIPFAWTAQQRIFQPPVAFLQQLSFDQWNALSFAAVVNMILILVALAFLLNALIGPGPSGEEAARSIVDAIVDSSRWKVISITTWHGRAIVVGLASIVGLIGFYLFGSTWMLLIGPVSAAVIAFFPRKVKLPSLGVFAFACMAMLLLAAWFEPVFATAIWPGFQNQSTTVENQEDGSYLPVLRLLMKDKSVRSVLTDQGYGVTWYSLGHVRSIDLVDATSVSAVGPELKSLSLDALYRRGVYAATIPTIGAGAYATFQRLGQILGAHVVPLLNDPLQGYAIEQDSAVGSWTLVRFFPPTVEVPHTHGSLSALLNGRSERISDNTMNVSPDAAISGFQVSLGRQFRNPIPITIEVLGYSLGDDGTKEPYFYRTDSAANQLGNIEIPSAALLSPNLSPPFSRSLAPTLERASPIVIRSITVTPQHSDSWSLDFRSEGLRLEPSRAISGFPFFLSGGENVADRIDIRGTYGDEVVWPYRVVSNSQRTSRSLTISLHPTPFCGPGSKLLIAVTGSKFYRAIRAQIPNSPELTSTAELPLPGMAPVNISSISLIGRGSSCALEERLSATGINISPKGLAKSVRWTDELHIASIRRR